MKSLIAALVFVTGLANAQSCTSPRSLTEAQKAMVSGKWTGHYELAGTRQDFSVMVDFQNEGEALTITNPPAEGALKEENLRFCHSGAFHFKKNLADGYFEFDGVPGAREIKGVLVVQTKGGRKTGDFVLQRAE